MTKATEGPRVGTTPKVLLGSVPAKGRVAPAAVTATTASIPLPAAAATLKSVRGVTSRCSKVRAPQLPVGRGGAAAVVQEEAARLVGILVGANSPSSEPRVGRHPTRDGPACSSRVAPRVAVRHGSGKTTVGPSGHASKRSIPNGPKPSVPLAASDEAAQAVTAAVALSVRPCLALHHTTPRRAPGRGSEQPVEARAAGEAPDSPPPAMEANTIGEGPPGIATVDVAAARNVATMARQGRSEAGQPPADADDVYVRDKGADIGGGQVPIPRRALVKPLLGVARNLPF